jgi:hypothetical protein
MLSRQRALTARTLPLVVDYLAPIGSAVEPREPSATHSSDDAARSLFRTIIDSRLASG